VYVSPEGGGTLEIDGDAPCSYPASATVDLRDEITLEAVPATGYHFIGWSGEPTVAEDDNPVVIEVINNIEITANFAPDFIKFTSEDGLLSLIIPDGTTALDGEGEPLSGIDFVADADPPPTQEARLIGHAYNLEPDGATFDPPATLTWGYGPSDIPEGVAEEALTIGYYDEEASQWVTLDSEVDLEKAIINAPIDHLSVFAVLAPGALPSEPVAASFTTTNFSIYPSEVNPGSEVTISVRVINGGEVEGSQDIALKINGVIEEMQNVTLGAASSSEVTFTVTKNEAGTYYVELNGFSGEFTVKESASSVPRITASQSTPLPPSQETPSGVNWVVVAPILAAVFLAIFLPLWLRRRRERLDW
jgi:hypothetical protein